MEPNKVMESRASLLPEPDHYLVLGVARTASPQAIEAAYAVALRRRRHPLGRWFGPPDEALRLAREVLADPVARRAYDERCASRHLFVTVPPA